MSRTDVWVVNGTGPPPAPVAARPAPPPPRPAAVPSPPSGRRRHRRLPLLAAAATALVVVLVWAGVASDLHTRSQLRQARSSLGTTTARLADTLKHLGAVEASLSSSTSERQTLQVELRLVAWELGGAQTNLANADAGLSSRDAHIASLNDCLGGVERALNQISVGNQQGATSSISGVSGSCQSAQGQGPGGPVFPFDFPDPDVIRVGASYFGYATNSATGDVQTIESTDLTHWSVLGDALSHLAAWARPGATWAPSVAQFGNTFVLYYAAADRTGGQECVSVALAAQPQGPFVDSTTAPLVCQHGLGGSIDPSPFVDTAGTAYLTWKSNGAGAHPATIWSQQLGPGGTSLVGPGPVALLQPTQGWQGGVVEGPFMLVQSGHYDLFYSANNWNGPDYAIGVATCQGPLGPCAAPSPGPLLGAQPGFVSPGGPSLFSDPQGGVWMAFHAYLPSAVGYPHSRLLFLRQVSFGDGLPAVQAG